jgi:hypothetical protein
MVIVKKNICPVFQLGDRQRPGLEMQFGLWELDQFIRPENFIQALIRSRSTGSEIALIQTPFFKIINTRDLS